LPFEIYTDISCFINQILNIELFSFNDQMTKIKPLVFIWKYFKNYSTTRSVVHWMFWFWSDFTRNPIFYELFILKFITQLSDPIYIYVSGVQQFVHKINTQVILINEFIHVFNFSTHSFSSCYWINMYFSMNIIIHVILINEIFTMYYRWVKTVI
jgi:hypothetical protein